MLSFIHSFIHSHSSKIFKTILVVLLSFAFHIANANEITVSAASSLTNAFKDIVKNYHALYPDAKVSLNFGASGALLQQIAHGAPVDVFASADQETMDEAQKLGIISTAERQNFVRNRLLLVQPILPASSNPPMSPIKPVTKKITLDNLQDLNQAEVKRIAIGNPTSVPVGRYAFRALEANQLWSVLKPKMILTQNVRQSLDYVVRGEVDAAFVYASDVVIVKDKINIAFDVVLQEAILYPIAPLKDSKHSAEAKRFIQFLFSAQSQAVFIQYGFQKP